MNIRSRSDCPRTSCSLEGISKKLSADAVSAHVVNEDCLIPLFGAADGCPPPVPTVAPQVPGKIAPSSELKPTAKAS